VEFFELTELRQLDSSGGFCPGTTLPSTQVRNAHLRGIPRFPDFYCIGAQKAGTTWLFHRLLKNPRFWLPEIKEIDHFSEMYLAKTREWARQQREIKFRDCGSPHHLKPFLDGLGKDDDSYGRMFSLAPPSTIVGDFSPEYMLLPHAAIAHVYRLSPHAKIVLLVRDPVHRFWSAAKHLAKSSDNLNDDLIAVMFDSPYVLSRSDYLGTILRWEKVFGHQSVHVCDFDLVAENPRMLLKDLHEFLNVDDWQRCVDGCEEVVHKSFTAGIPDKYYEPIVQQMKLYIYSFAEKYPEIGGKWIARHGL